MMMTDKEKQNAKLVVGIVLVIGVVYLVGSGLGLVPDDYNIFRLTEDEEIVVLANGTGYVDGIPTEVNVTAQENNSYTLSFICNESYISGMELVLETDTNLTNTTTYWSATDTDWSISDDRLTATYVGDPLTIGVEIDALVLHVDGGDAEGEISLTVYTDVGDLYPEEATIDVIV